MNIPQVNTGATDHNREQTQRILELHAGVPDGSIYAISSINVLGVEIKLPNNSFTLDQVVEMLEVEGYMFLTSEEATPTEHG